MEQWAALIYSLRSKTRSKGRLPKSVVCSLIIWVTKGKLAVTRGQCLLSSYLMRGRVTQQTMDQDEVMDVMARVLRLKLHKKTSCDIPVRYSGAIFRRDIPARYPGLIFRCDIPHNRYTIMFIRQCELPVAKWQLQWYVKKQLMTQNEGELQYG
jgi:hypothetical protein